MCEQVTCPEAQPHRPCANGRAGVAAEGFTAPGPRGSWLSCRKTSKRAVFSLHWPGSSGPGLHVLVPCQHSFWRPASPRPAEDGAGPQLAAARSATSGGFTACSGDVRMNGWGGVVFLTWSLTLAVDFLLCVFNRNPQTRKGRG